MERHNSGIQGNAHKSQEPQSRQLESRAQDERAISLLVVGTFRITSHGKPTTGQVAAGCPVGFRVSDHPGVTALWLESKCGARPLLRIALSPNNKGLPESLQAQWIADQAAAIAPNASGCTTLIIGT